MAFLAITFKDVPADEVEKVKTDLLTYCKMDTDVECARLLIYNCPASLTTDSLKLVRDVIESWRIDYVKGRPHSS